MKYIYSRAQRIIFIALALCFAFGGSISAQEESSATITGQVTDSTGAAVANATVVVTSTTTNQARTVQTNEEGSYSVFPLLPGTYTVSVEQPGFKRSVVNTTLNARDRRPIDIALEIGEASAVVTVTAEAPLLQESPTGQALVSGNQVTELPLNNRNFIRLLETVPGVSSDLSEEAGFGLTSLANISINGLRRNAVNYLVDGVNNSDVGSNITLLSSPTVDSIAEVKVLTSNYTAEIGRSGGGAVIITTRGGGNQFHGNLYEFVRNDHFNANSFFNNRLGRRADGSLVADVPKLRYNNFGGTFSGPVVVPGFGEGTPAFYKLKDRTFFFFSEEQRRIIRGVSDTLLSTPSLAERQGNFSGTLGLPLCRQTNNTISTNCTAAGAVAVNVIDTNGATIQARQSQIFRPTDGRAYAGNIVPLSDIDPRSLGLLQAYPLPNIGVNGYQQTPLNILNTRQEVIRIDHNFTSNHKIFGRYTQDRSQTQESLGLFNPGVQYTGIGTTNTSVPGKVFAVGYTGIFSNSLVNEATFNFSGNEISSVLVGRGRRTDYTGAALIQQVFPENNANAIPTITSRFGTIGALQGYSIEYANVTFKDNLTYTTGNHIFKFGAEVTHEIKNENTGGATQGNFGFSAIQTQGSTLNSTGGAIGITGTGDSFASFLLGRANSYSEAQTDFRVNLRFGRREFYAQDTWRIRPNVTLDLGVRYQYFVSPYDANNRIGSFDPSLYNRSAITCTTPACTAFTLASNQVNGIGIAGDTSRFGRSVAPSDYNNFSPRFGIAYSPDFENGIGRTIFGGPNKSIIRAGYGFYYDQVLVGIFEQAAFTVPAFSPNVSYSSGSTAATTVTFDNPSAGAAAGTFPNRALVAISPDFETPETQVWSIGLQREVFKNAVIDISYVGTKGDKLVRRRNINFISPQTALANGATTTVVGNSAAARPFVGYSTITYQETAAKSRYHGLLSSFNYRLQNGFTITLAYTFSKALTDSTNDRDAIDEPQNPLVPNEYALARTDRPHVFSASYVYELPFFRKSENSFLRLLLGGYQLSGITQIESGAPVPRFAVESTQNGTRGLYPNVIGNPNGGLAGTIDPVTGLPFIFDPTAFEPAATGQFGSATRSFARLPMRNQTNLALSKQFYFNTERTMYLQLRAESFNLFNTTQFVMAAGTATTLPTAGALSNTIVGRPTGTRLPREFQFG
ncbi:MAG TPA: carboxypeptidase regulatory-like domain-containing protein, partial [Pyrinomonadaceae bacterium]